MSLRSFTVFQDTPSSEPVRASVKATAVSLTSTSISSPLLENPGHATTLASTAEKENLDPVTGERTGPNNSKKRKTSNVLATKVHRLPTESIKILKEGKESQPESKKRKSSSSSTVLTTKTKLGAPKKEGKKEGKASTRKTSKRALNRRVSPLPKVDEEVAVGAEPLTQATIDSKCYELTVQPLADVSDAYKQVGVAEELLGEEKVKFRKASSAEPEIRDYFAPRPSSSSNPTLPSAPITRSTALAVKETRTFSTPERKKIYAAFTFSSPSPTSERFNKVARAGNAPPPKLNLAKTDPFA